MRYNQNMFLRLAAIHRCMELKHHSCKLVTPFCSVNLREINRGVKTAIWLI